MKLNCIVQLCNKESRHVIKWQRSILSLEKKIDSYKIEAYLVWETEDTNRVKYLISTRNLCNHRKNLMTTCTYTNSRKDEIEYFLMRFKNPLHILQIQSNDKASFQDFTVFVHLMNTGRWYSLYKKSSITSNFILTIAKIKRKKKFREERLPKITETLILRNLNITELDLQSIFNLHSLRVLDLSYNYISSLPKELGTLPHLEKLDLSHNYLGYSLVIPNWEWMEQIAISQSLKELIIKYNALSELPLQVGNLQSLIRLDVSYNLLTKVPQIIGTLQQLALLNVSNNYLTYLPGSMRGMELCYLSIKNNSFEALHIEEYRLPTLKVMSLLDLAAKTVEKYRISYNDVPSTIVRYLDNCKYCCICRNLCFHSDIKIFEPLLDRPTRLIETNGNFLSNVCQDSDMVENRRILFKCYFCSSKCYAYFRETH